MYNTDRSFARHDNTSHQEETEPVRLNERRQTTAFLFLYRKPSLCKNLISAESPSGESGVESHFASLIRFEAAIMKNAAGRLRDISDGEPDVHVNLLFLSHPDQWAMRNTSWGHEGRNYLNHNRQLTSSVCLPVAVCLQAESVSWTSKWLLIVMYRKGDCWLGSRIDCVIIICFVQILSTTGLMWEHLAVFPVGSMEICGDSQQTDLRGKDLEHTNTTVRMKRRRRRGVRLRSL